MIYNRRTRVRAGNRFECVLLEPANPVADPRGVYTVGLGPDFVRESSNVLEHGRVGQDSRARDTGFRLASVSSPCENQRVPRLTIKLKQWGFFSGRAATFQPALLFSVVFLFFFFLFSLPEHICCLSPLTRLLAAFLLVERERPLERNRTTWKFLCRLHSWLDLNRTCFLIPWRRT